MLAFPWDMAEAGSPIDTGPYKFSSEAFFADDATITGVVTAYTLCVGQDPLPPYDPAEVGLYVTGFTPNDAVNDVGQINSMFCSQNGQELELGFTDILPYETNGPDVVIFDGRTYSRDMLVAVRPVGDSFGELVLYGPDDNLPTTLEECAFPTQRAVGVDFERHGLLPGTVVDRIRIVADCNVTIHASEYIISMAAVVDHSCAADDDCNDQNDCTTDFCGSDGICKVDPHPAGTPCDDGFCDGLQIPHCLSCLDDSYCAAPTPVCHPSDAQCVECDYNHECAAPKPYCDWMSNVCVPCLEHGQCDDGNECTLDTCDEVEGCHSQLLSKGAPCSSGVCDGSPEGPACVECLENEDCPEAEPHCRESDGRCTECRYDSDCNDFIVCTEDICASGSCFSYDDSGQCSAEGGGGAGGSTTSTGASNGAGGVGGADEVPPEDGCDCRVAPTNSPSWPLGLLPALGLAIVGRRGRRPSVPARRRASSPSRPSTRTA